MKKHLSKLTYLFAGVTFLVGALVSKKAVKNETHEMVQNNESKTQNEENKILNELLDSADTDAFQKNHKQLVATSFER